MEYLKVIGLVNLCALAIIPVGYFMEYLNTLALHPMLVAFIILNVTALVGLAIVKIIE